MALPRSPSIPPPLKVRSLDFVLESALWIFKTTNRNSTLH